jgi:hypothetical protein
MVGRRPLIVQHERGDGFEVHVALELATKTITEPPRCDDQELEHPTTLKSARLRSQAFAEHPTGGRGAAR